MSSDGSRLTKLEGLVRSLGARLASNVGAVSSVFGRTGAVVAAVNDYTWAQINKTTSSLADITTRAESALTFTDITTNDVSSTKHGFAPKSPANAAQFLNGAATPAYAAVKDSDLSTSDITTNDATTLKHGFLLKLGGGTTNFLRADGTWNAPAAGNWDRLATATNAADAASLSSGTFTAKKNLLVIGYIVGLSIAGNVGIRFNSDSAANYSGRRDLNSATAAQTSDTSIAMHDTTTADRKISFAFFVTNNAAGSRKLMMGVHTGNTESAATAPDSSQFSGVWHDTVSQITSVQFIFANLRANSEIHVYGSD